eukprot:GILJ01016976.1.p3 GENE.GILJ01016976.1~~GILJ01016976.1.p3  ORF type:complete len:173 (+),score=15.72 GILJ01016976.1:1505-2023(+)
MRSVKLIFVTSARVPHALRPARSPTRPANTPAPSLATTHNLYTTTTRRRNRCSSYLLCPSRLWCVHLARCLFNGYATVCTLREPSFAPLLRHSAVDSPADNRYHVAIIHVTSHVISDSANLQTLMPTWISLNRLLTELNANHALNRVCAIAVANIRAPFPVIRTTVRPVTDW